MSIAGSQELSLLPNLPGYRPNASNAHKDTHKKQNIFDLNNGMVMIKDTYLPSIAVPEFGEEPSLSSFQIGSMSPTKRPQTHNILDDAVVLTFHAYFEEKPIDNPGKVNIRKCAIYFTLNDGTVKIVEKPQLNSGCTQGTLVKKSTATKDNGELLVASDLKIGAEISIFKRKYRIVDCDGATRRYLEANAEFGEDVGGPMSVPEDPYQTYRARLEPGANPAKGKFCMKKNENSTFQMALMNCYVNNSGRDGFLRYGNTTLNFKCVWDNTGILYGDVMQFSMAYYLADDTLEITSLPNILSNDTSRAKLLKRAKLPKEFMNTRNLAEKPPADSFVHWTDLYVGLNLDVFGRDLLLVDADPKTREFYASFDCPLADCIELKQPEVVVHKREIPPPTGFGSEEDSMRSVEGSLMPGPAPVKKLGEPKILSFFCSLLSGGIDDVDRRFVISYYVSDNTLKIVEPPVRNSGFNGGLFLSRRAVKNPDGTTMTEKDIFVGKELQVLKHRFLVLDSNDSTYKWLEDKARIHVKNYPRSNFYLIIDKIRGPLLEGAGAEYWAERFRKFETPAGPDGGGPKQATVETFHKLLVEAGFVFDNTPENMSLQELITIRRGNGNKSNTFNYVKILEQIVQPTDEFK